MYLEPTQLAVYMALNENWLTANEIALKAQTSVPRTMESLAILAGQRLCYTSQPRSGRGGLRYRKAVMTDAA